MLRNGIRWDRKPPLGTPLDRSTFWGSSCFGMWAMNEGGGATLYDGAGRATRMNIGVQIGTPAWAMSPHGLAIVTSGFLVWRVAPGAGAAALESITDNVTYEAIFTVNNAVTGTAQAVFAKGAGDLRLYIAATTGVMTVDVSGRVASQTGPVAVGGTWYHVALRSSSALAATDLFVTPLVSGPLATTKYGLTSATPTNPISYTSSDFEVGARSPGGLFLAGQFAKVAVYRGVPSDGQMFDLARNRWAMFATPARRVALAPPAAPPAAVAGTQAGEFGFRGGWLRPRR